MLLTATDRYHIVSQFKQLERDVSLTPLRLRLIRNPNMALNGRFPTAVGDFKYEINR